jgi:hypothetical protein
VKALSGRQPWWWAILHAGKRIENRVWNTNYRGLILLHAAKGCTRDEYEDACVWMENAGVIHHVDDVPKLADMQRGGIVGQANIIGVVPPGGIPPAFRHGYEQAIDYRWHMDDQYGFILADVQPRPFVAYKGSLGLFDIPASVVQPALTGADAHER